jgi:hypothetical protein
LKPVIPRKNIQETTIHPLTLFKYRDDSDRTESIFRDGKVWLSSPSQLNDPMECKTGEIPEPWQTATIRQLEVGQLMGIAGLPGLDMPSNLFSLNARQTKQWWKRFRILSHKQKVAAMRKLYADHGIELSRPEEIFRDMRKRLAEVGIFSLSEVNDSELMWSHYGANHSGLTIGFGCTPDCLLGNARHTHQVTSSEEKPVFKTGFKNELTISAVESGGIRSKSRVSFEDDVFRAAISTKTPTWAYEREWRFVEEKSGLHDWPGKVVSVTFGLKMAADRRRHYRQLIKSCANVSVELFEVQISRSMSALTIRELTAI